MFRDASNLALTKCKLSMILDNGQELAYDYFHGRFVAQLPSVSAKSVIDSMTVITRQALQHFFREPCWLIWCFFFFLQLNWRNLKYSKLIKHFMVSLGGYIKMILKYSMSFTKAIKM